MQIERLLYLLSTANSPFDVVMAWRTVGPIGDNSRAIITLENYRNSILPDTITKVVYSEDNDFIPYLQSQNVYFINNEILKTVLSSGKIDIPVDYSVMFDTNYASYIHQFVNNNINNFNNEIFRSIDILLRENFQYDYYFYLVENSKTIDLELDYDINYFIKTHKSIYENLVSLELFKSVDEKLYRDKRKIKYTLSQSEARHKAEELIGNLFCSQEGKDHLKYLRFLQKQMTLFLIGVFQINFSSNRSPQKKMKELFDFMNEKVGIYFEREAIVAYKYFKEKGNIRIFRKIQRNIDALKTLELIDNIAWDFTAPRIMEFFMRFGGEGKFFLPFFLSHDLGLKEILKLFNVKGVIIEGNSAFIPFPSIITREYFENEKCAIDFDFYFSEENKSKRKARLNKNREVIEEMIIEEFNKLIRVMQLSRS
jgi:hypothetical protein